MINVHIEQQFTGNHMQHETSVLHKLVFCYLSPNSVSVYRAINIIHDFVIYSDAWLLHRPWQKVYFHIFSQENIHNLPHLVMWFGDHRRLFIDKRAHQMELDKSCIGVREMMCEVWCTWTLPLPDIQLAALASHLSPGPVYHEAGESESPQAAGWSFGEAKGGRGSISSVICLERVCNHTLTVDPEVTEAFQGSGKLHAASEGLLEALEGHFWFLPVLRELFLLFSGNQKWLSKASSKLFEASKAQEGCCNLPLPQITSWVSWGYLGHLAPWDVKTEGASKKFVLLGVRSLIYTTGLWTTAHSR